MAKNITIEITDSEFRCLEYAVGNAAGMVEWTDNVVTERARHAKLEILPLLTAHCNAKSIAMAVGEEAQIEQAFTLGVVKTAEEREAELNAELAKKQG